MASTNAYGNGYSDGVKQQSVRTKARITDLQSQLADAAQREGELRAALSKGWTLGQYEWAVAHPDEVGGS